MSFPLPGHRVHLCAAALIALVSHGCAGPAGRVTLATPQGLEVGDLYDDRAWAMVLRENVKSGVVEDRRRDGLVDYGHLASHRLYLDEYLAMVAEVGPERRPDQFPTRESRVCYYVNVYNAGVLAAALAEGVPERLHSAEGGAFDRRIGLRVDGAVRTLGELRDEAIEASAGDPRVLFELSDGAMGSPALRDQPLRAEGLDERLRETAKAAMDDQNMVWVDHEHQRLMLSTVMMRYRGDFIEDFRRATGAADATMLNVVLRYAGSVRRQWLNTAVGYAEAIIPFDRRLNRWRREP